MKHRQALIIQVRGVVQGVGFRPYVYQLAQKYNLTGWVQNTSGDVTIFAEGEVSGLQNFLSGVKKGPPQSCVKTVSAREVPLQEYSLFEIKDSRLEENAYQLISPDLATCSECLNEIFDHADRRYRYPFTNCTNCGPRFTIIRDIPYDRPFTAMSTFRMCPACQKEYHDPLDRRFHAQPNACPVCGPALQLVDPEGRPLAVEDLIKYAADLIKEGRILAVKGLGGFLLACDATNNEVVRRLRERKQRLSKPFAIMVADLKDASQYVSLTDFECEVLCSPASPILLGKMKPGTAISALVAPGLKYLGIMLPYTPLQHLLVRQAGLPLVMTSGNLSEEPIAAGNEEALNRLNNIADCFIIHNRDICSRYDDSVVAIEKNSVQIVRRARGYAPFPVQLDFSAKKVLACGAELKNTFCLTRDNYAFVSQHMGDLENAETMDNFESTEKLYERLFRIQPEIVVCDLHPDYLSTRWAQAEALKLKLPLVQIQHHHAHIVSCMADNAIAGPVIGVAFDGSGYGPDGRIWGGEFMISERNQFQRRACFEYLPLAGGSLAITKPYRTAVGYLFSLFGDGALSPDLPCLKGRDDEEIGLIKQQIRQSINTPLTSSCGRLFDAVSSLIGVCQQTGYEGQAAIELEAAADENVNGPAYPFGIERQNELYIIHIGDMLKAIISEVKKSVPIPVISARFHWTISQIITQVCLELHRETGIRQVALSGGVFQNRRLSVATTAALQSQGLVPLVHSQVPCNDGGISLGQAVIANFITAGK